MSKNICDFGGESSQIYEKECSNCGNIIKVSTQEDIRPEYYTDVFILCECGESVHFFLPVN